MSHRKLMIGLSLLLFLLTGLVSYAVSAQQQRPDPKLGQIVLPDGFSIEVYADDVRGARSLELSPNGILYVSTRRAANAYAVIDKDGDAAVDEVIVLDHGLTGANGIALLDGGLYLAQTDKIWKIPDIDNNLRNLPEPELIFDGLPSDRSHGWKYLAAGPDGKLYFDIGAPGNIVLRPDPYATMARLNPGGTGFEIYARGVRHSVGMDWHPETGELWFTDNGSDNLGGKTEISDNYPPCELNYAPEPGAHFGYPYRYSGNPSELDPEIFGAGPGILDPEFGGRAKDFDITLAAMPLGPHVAPLGMRFYTGDMFPEEYRKQVFIAEHGSWNRSRDVSHTGYKVTLVRLDGNRAVSYEDFASGWLNPDGRSRWGRPVDVEILPDGSMLVSDDFGGRIFRITYKK